MVQRNSTWSGRRLVGGNSAVATEKPRVPPQMDVCAPINEIISLNAIGLKHLFKQKTVKS